MILSDGSIRRYLEAGTLAIEPRPTEAQLQPASVDVTLGHSFIKPRPGRAVDPENPPAPEDCERIHRTEAFGLYPGEFILGSTVQRFRIPDDLVARVEGLSTLGRLGLLVHATAGFVDPGFEGDITLEICNIGPRAVWLRPGMRIAQIAFTITDSPVERPYGSVGNKYQGQCGATAARPKRRK